MRTAQFQSVPDKQAQCIEIVGRAPMAVALQSIFPSDGRCGLESRTAMRREIGEIMTPPGIIERWNRTEYASCDFVTRTQRRPVQPIESAIAAVGTAVASRSIDEAHPACGNGNGTRRASFWLLLQVDESATYSEVACSRCATFERNSCNLWTNIGSDSNDARKSPVDRDRMSLPMTVAASVVDIDRAVEAPVLHGAKNNLSAKNKPEGSTFGRQQRSDRAQSCGSGAAPHRFSCFPDPCGAFRRGSPDGGCRRAVRPACSADEPKCADGFPPRDQRSPLLQQRVQTSRQYSSRTFRSCARNLKLKKISPLPKEG